jgi:hypothetical protein
MQKVVLCALVFSLLAGCGGGGGGGGGLITSAPTGTVSCSGNLALSRSPVDVRELKSVTPLGNLNPQGGHVFPTDHLYFMTVADPGSATTSDVVAPANIVIARLQQQTRSGGGMPTVVDYNMTYFACADVMMTFAHLTSVTPALLSQAGSLTGSCNSPYNINGVTYQQCNKEVSINVTAGTQIGTIGGPTALGSFDVGAYDRRITLAFVSPGRSTEQGSDFNPNHTACFIDYIAGADADALRGLLGRPGNPRTVAPVCGEAMQDVPNTAQGRWFFDAASSESQGVGLVHDNFDPTNAVFSIGNAVTSLPIGGYTFQPIASGTINADFSRVTADGQVYCYQSFQPSNLSNMHIMVQMPNSTTLLIAGVSGSICSSGAVMPSNATRFTR